MDKESDQVQELGVEDLFKEVLVSKGATSER